MGQDSERSQGCPSGQQRAPQALRSLRVQAVGPIWGKQAAGPPPGWEGQPGPSHPLLSSPPTHLSCVPRARASTSLGSRAGCPHPGGGCVAEAGPPHLPPTAIKGLLSYLCAGPRGAGGLGPGRQGRLPAGPSTSHAPTAAGQGPAPTSAALCSKPRSEPGPPSPSPSCRPQRGLGLPGWGSEAQAAFFPRPWDPGPCSCLWPDRVTSPLAPQPRPMKGCLKAHLGGSRCSFPRPQSRGSPLFHDTLWCGWTAEAAQAPGTLLRTERPPREHTLPCAWG